MSASIRPLATLIAAAMGAATLAGTAHAASPDIETRNVTIRTDDIDLSSPKGAAMLEARVRHAVTRVCGTPGGRDLTLDRTIAACRRTAMNGAAPQVRLAITGARADQRIALNAAPARPASAH